MKPAIGIQLYTLRDYIKTPADFDKTLGVLENMGVSDVQISAIGDFPAQEQNRILQKHNMKVCVTHKTFEKFENELEALIEDHKTIDCDALGIGSAPEKSRGSAKKVRAFIEKANEISAKLQENNMTFNYHNHAFEFEKLDDMACTMMDLLLEETDKDSFKFIADVAWIHYAGYNPVDILKRMKGRIKVIHFKDYIVDENLYRHFVPLGKGVVNLKECYDFACENNIPYIMYEQDDDFENDDPFKATQESWNYLKMLLEKGE